jgi:hypothetical protein
VIWLTALLVFGVTCAIAAVFVLREAGRLASEPLPPVFDVDEAYEWVVEHLPDDVAATLTTADVRRILDFQLEFLTKKGVTGNGSSPRLDNDVIVGGAEIVDHICARSRETGEEYLPEQVYGVLDTQLGYLRAIGAVGGAAPPPEGPRPRRPGPDDTL